MSSETNSLVTSTTPRQLGRVKWFNNKAGYGFITVTTKEQPETDVFVHHSCINVGNEQYKYLVQGEYVEFKLEKANGGSHEFQATEVSGINNGKLMCETRRDFKQIRVQYKEGGENMVDTPRVNFTGTNSNSLRDTHKATRGGEGPRADLESDWKLVGSAPTFSSNTAPTPTTPSVRGRGRPPKTVTI